MMRTRRNVFLPALLCLTALFAGACGGGATPSTTASGIADGSDLAGIGTLEDSRTGQGILAAGGIPLGGGNCMSGDMSASEPFKIAWIGPDLSRLAELGLQTLDIEPPHHMLNAYVNEINRLGGVNGHCFETDINIYRITDPEETAADLTRICTELPQKKPLILLSLRMSDVTFGCLTLAGRVPTFTINSSLEHWQFESASPQVFDDRGSTEYQLASSLEVTKKIGGIDSNDRLALLYIAPDQPADDSEEAIRAAAISEATANLAIETAKAAAERLGLNLVSFVPIQSGFEELELVVLEEWKRQIERGERSDPIPAEAEAILTQLDQYYSGVAAQLQSEGITAVASTGGWATTRRLMVQAELIDWLPTWIGNDIQTASLILSNAPDRQAQNLWQASSWRAPGDPLDGSDLGCHSLRNTLDMAPFGYRHHTDAWVVMMSTCDVLDMVFGAVAKAGVSLTQESFVAALEQTSMTTRHGLTLGFSPDDRNGARTLRALRADPTCALNPWGCLRPVEGTEWVDVTAATDDIENRGVEGSSGG